MAGSPPTAAPPTRCAAVLFMETPVKMPPPGEARKQPGNPPLAALPLRETAEDASPVTHVCVFRLGTAEAERTAGDASQAEVVRGHGGQAG